MTGFGRNDGLQPRGPFRHPAGQPDSDYTITNEVIDDLHYEVSIRAAVGDLPKGSCLHRRDVNLTVFAPKITHGKAVIAEAGPMAPQVITALVEAIESHPGIKATRATTRF